MEVRICITVWILAKKASKDHSWWREKKAMCGQLSNQGSDCTGPGIQTHVSACEDIGWFLKGFGACLPSLSLHSHPLTLKKKKKVSECFTEYVILQARILKWVAIPFSRRSSQPKNQTQVSCIADRSFTVWATRETLTEISTLWSRWVSDQRKRDLMSVCDTLEKSHLPSLKPISLKGE